jgi:hypothetical protein
VTDPAKFGQTNKRRVRESEKKRRDFIERFREERDLDVACAAVGIARSTYSRWRERHPDFAHRVDELRLDDANARPQAIWDLGFAEFRLRYFKMLSPWFHLKAIHALEHTPPGNITMILWPPEHGKTTLFEDYASYRLAVDPNYRFTVGSEKQHMSRKILARVKNRMSAGGPFREYVAKWGPFEPQRAAAIQQPWQADYFSVHKKAGFDERDYSMVALGIDSAIAGTRTDHLHVDDVTSLKNYNLTPKLVEVFRQDWLSRPGERGRTTINGTRVGEQDFYEVLMDHFGTDLMRVIKLPAVVWNSLNEAYEPLWPYDPDTGAGYTMEMLERTRAKVGEEAWARNYMQNPLAAGDRTFTDAHVKAMANPTRALGVWEPRRGAGIVTLDPALGGYNVVEGLVMYDEKLCLAELFEDQRLTSYEQVFARVEEMVLFLQGWDVPVTDVVIEANAFQKGLASDRQLLAMQDRYGFAIRSHLTGDNKYDQEIGIASMARDCRLGLVEFPYAGDDRTRHEMGQLTEQLKRWRPNVKGARLRQDRLMALWFGWILWRERRGAPAADPSQFSFSGMPYRPTHTGILVPTGALR